MDEELVYAVDTRPTESAPGDLEGLLNGSLLTPSGEKEPVQVKDNKDGTYDISCVPKEPGPHELAVDYDGVPLVGSPFKFDAVEGGADKVKAYGKGKFLSPHPFPSQSQSILLPLPLLISFFVHRLKHRFDDRPLFRKGSSFFLLKRQKPGINSVYNCSYCFQPLKQSIHL